MGINANDVYRGDFIKSNRDGSINLPGNPERVVLTLKDDFDVQKFDDGKSQVVCGFVETDMTFGLNSGNAGTIIQHVGSADTSRWVGLKVELSTIPDTSGKSKSGHRIILRVSKQPATATSESKKLGAAAEAKLVGTLTERSLMLEHLTAWLIANGCDNRVNSAIAEWPSDWGQKIKAWLENPVKATVITEDDIPF